MTYIAYSTASANVLGHAETIESALSFTPENDFIVLFECPESEAAKLESWSLPRKDMPIVWRGENPLAQNFRR